MSSGALIWYSLHLKLLDLISFHSWVIHFIVGGPCEVVVFFLFLSIVLIKTNWIELMVPSPRITVLPSQSCSSLKWDKSSVPRNQTWKKKKSTRQRSHLPCLLLLLRAHYHIFIGFTNNNVALKRRQRVVWTKVNLVALDVTMVVIHIKSLHGCIISWFEIKIKLRQANFCVKIHLSLQQYLKQSVNLTADNKYECIMSLYCCVDVCMFSTFCKGATVE